MTGMRQSENYNSMLFIFAATIAERTLCDHEGVVPAHQAVKVPATDGMPERIA